MGWDCYAAAFKIDGHNQVKVINSEQRKAFKDASESVKKKAKGVDWFLEFGGLDCSACAEMLQEATGMNCWGNDLTPEEVKAYAEKADWDFDYDKSLDWAYWSARIFLETVVKCNLPIRFSW